MNEHEQALYDEAVSIIVGSGKASISLLQRRMRIGFSQAHGLMAAMEARGIVSPANTLGQRTVIPDQPRQAEE